MAIQKRYPRQMPFVGTEEQYSAVERVATERSISMAEVIREAIDAHFGLKDGEPERADAEAR